MALDNMKMFVDVHCHLADAKFNEDFPEVIERAQKAGVAACIVVTEYFKDFSKVLELTKQYPHFLAPCFGIHPVQLDDQNMDRSVTLKDLDEAVEMINKHHDILIAIGEVGLDFTPRVIKNPEDKQIQAEVFAKQIQFAKQYDLPVNVHSRSAGLQAITLLKEQNVSKAVLHAFSGKFSSALDGVRAGYYFSVPPCIVHSPQKQKLFKQLPMENIVLETDSPALSHEPQTRNEPANITVACTFLAELKKVSPDEIQRKTFENTFKLFPSLKQYL